MTIYITNWLPMRDKASHRTELTADSKAELDIFMQQVLEEAQKEAAKHGESVNPPEYRWDPVTWCYLVDNPTASRAALMGARLLSQLEMGRYMGRRAELQHDYPDDDNRREPAYFGI